jgi:7-cyano-7-deazaguanine synthase in queuosine biosynthesis
MKIKVGSYNVREDRKKSYVDIDILITYSDGCTEKTRATICLSQISYFFPRNKKQVRSFLLFAAIVYAIDRSVERKRFSVDGWSREFDVLFRIPESDLFKQSKELINQMLGYLTGDYWNCNFEDCNSFKYPIYKECDYFESISQVNLFSGGMDSLIGAIDYMASDKEGKVFLASHYDSSMGGPKTDQRRLLDRFFMKYKDRYLCFPKGSAVLIESSMSKETTCRSRSLMFIAIALQVAEYRKVEIVIPENGSVSLNFPLSVSRRSSCSTRTTHPVVLQQLRILFEALNLSTNITNPYEFMTKGEMVKSCLDIPFLLAINSQSNSCGKRGRKQFFIDNSSATHCGRCMPCMYRKAALIGYNDNTQYGITISHLFGKKDKKLSDDFYAMLNFLSREITEDDIRKELLIAGLGRLPNIDGYVDLVVRTRQELRRLVEAEGDNSVKQYIGAI